MPRAGVLSSFLTPLTLSLTCTLTPNNECYHVALFSQLQTAAEIPVPHGLAALVFGQGGRRERPCTVLSVDILVDLLQLHQNPKALVFHQG